MGDQQSNKPQTNKEIAKSYVDLRMKMSPEFYSRMKKKVHNHIAAMLTNDEGKNVASICVECLRITKIW
jgi:hypothetical protein